MNPTLRVLAMVAVTLTTVPSVFNDNVIEYGAGAKQWIAKHFPQLEETTATLINANTKTRYRLEQRKTGAFTLKPSPSADVASKHPICGHSLGIRPGGQEEIFVGPSSLTLSVIASHENIGVLAALESDKSIQLDLHFASRYSEKEVIFTVPFFKIPSSVPLGDLKAFAASAKVGIAGPDAFQDISGLRVNKPITLDFKWLEDLLKKGVFFSNQENVHAKIYLTQPVLLPDNTLDGMIKVLKK